MRRQAFPERTGVVVGADLGRSRCSRTGPVSSPASITIVVTPVRVEPEQERVLDRRGPPSAGRSEKCRFTGATAGSSSTAGGQDLAVGHHDQHVRRGASTSASKPGSRFTVSTSRSARSSRRAGVGHGGRRELRAAAGRLRDAGDHQGGAVFRRRERLEGRHRPRVVAQEHDPERAGHGRST